VRGQRRRLKLTASSMVVRQPCMEERPKRRRSFSPSAETLSVLGVLRYTPISAPTWNPRGNLQRGSTKRLQNPTRIHAARLIRENWNTGPVSRIARPPRARRPRFGRDGREGSAIDWRREESREQLTRRRTEPPRRCATTRRGRGRGVAEARKGRWRRGANSICRRSWGGGAGGRGAGRSSVRGGEDGRGGVGDSGKIAYLLFLFTS
jgi:hypothetical protein